MDRSGAKSRVGNRKPLGDGSSRANVNSTPPHRTKPRTSPASSLNIPHHESLAANGALTVRNATASPDNKRVSAVASEEEDKRNSQVSNASTNASRKKTHIGPWRLGKSIGDGSVGQVRLVRHCITGQFAAAKIIDKKVAEMARAESMAHLVRPERDEKVYGHLLPFGIEREVVIMKLLEHDNIVRLYDVWENRSQLYIIMEYVDGGELFHYITSEGESTSLYEDEAFWVFRQIVAALLHSHRLGIYHRDLKPENILLCASEDNAPIVKLADFGMAALQPPGKKLTTPCGSIHYAAPEIFKSSYDGAKVDVWSLGIILYVMLVGQIPFLWGIPLNEEDYYAEWYNAITNNELDIPEGVSPEAADLLRRMLVADPEKRISMPRIWTHPFFVKWGQIYSSNDERTTMEAWMGVHPQIRSWLTSSRDIDRETLRNLKVLWHSEKEEVLINKLLNKDANLEKLFYSALIKHREEALENYVGTADDLAYTASDHQHYLKPVYNPSELPPLPPSAFVRTKSNFSILNDELKRSHSRTSTPRPPHSERSYDPFRASRSSMTRGKENHHATTQRGHSFHSRKRSGSQNIKPANSLRIEAIRREQQRHSQQRHSTGSSSIKLTRKSSSSPRPVAQGSTSRMSLTSSSYANSPSGSILVKPSNVHKRGVDFSRVRRSSTVSGLSTRSPIETPRKSTGRIVAPQDSVTDISESQSPAVNENKRVGSRKDTLLTDLHRARLGRSQTQSQVIESEARKVSTELEQICDQLFNRSSAGSSNATSGTYGQSSYETPPSSISNRASTHSTPGLPGGSKQQDYRGLSRALPERPTDTPNTYIAKELAETRKKIFEKYALNPDARESKDSREVLAQIDAFLQHNAAIASAYDARGNLAGAALQSPLHSGHLPIISEEDKHSDDSHSMHNYAKASHRAKPNLYDQRQVVKPTNPQNTVRLIDPTSPRRPAPLNVRKASGKSTDSLSQQPPPAFDQVQQRFYGNYPFPPPGSPARRSLIFPRSGSLDPITESSARDRVQADAGTAPQKARQWFRRKPVTGNAPNGPLPRAQSINGSSQFTGMDLSRKVKQQPGASDGSGRSPLGSPTFVVPGKRPGFLAFLTRKRSPKGAEKRIYIGGDDDSLPGPRSNDAVSTSTSYTKNPKGKYGFYQHQHHSRKTIASDDQGSIDIRDLGVQRNWLARFLNIKPATYTMCFNTSRGRARVELTRLLRSWKMYGVCEVVADKQRGLVFGRLAADNYLRLKEVAFVCQLFVVLEQGERANLSIARFTQRKGAASSFRIVVAKVEDLLMGKGLMVSDANKRREMEDVLNG